MQAERLRWLKGIPIFGALSDETLAFVLRRSTAATVEAGNHFFRQGDPGESMFVLESGEVEVLHDAGLGPQLLASLGPGDCFGEMALIECAPRSASVRALVECGAFEVSFGSLHELYRADPEQFVLLQMNMSREVSRRLRAAGDLLARAQAELRSLDAHGLYM